MAANNTRTEKMYPSSARTQAIQKLFNASNFDVHFSIASTEQPGSPQNQQIGAHKMWLSAISPVFGAMFTGHWKETSTVSITDASFNGFQAFLKYFYTDRFSINDETVADVLNLANKYDVPELKLCCAAFLLEHVMAENVVDWLGLAVLFEIAELSSKCRAIISGHTQQVITSPAFMQCSNAVLFEILSISWASCADELVFDACIEWAKLKCQQQNIDATRPEHLRTMLGSCFDRIRLTRMSQSARKERLTRYQDMFSKEEIIELLSANDENAMLSPSSEYALAFGYVADKYRENRYSFILRTSHDMKLVAFSLPVETAEEAFGQIGSHFTGVIWIDEFGGDPAKSTTSYPWHAMPNDNSNGVYRFPLSPVHLHRKYAHMIYVDYKDLTERAYKYVVKGQVVRDVTFTLSYSKRTYFAALHFEKCDE